MAISVSSDIQESQVWPQEDIRSPLGVWGFRQGITGDATGGSIKVQAVVPALRRSAYVYTCYSAIIVQLTGTLISAAGKIRLLTNWPDVDPFPGIQAFSTGREVDLVGSAAFTEPILVPNENMVGPLDRFILLFDPRRSGLAMPILELEIGLNTDTDTYAFEGYGYFWDRSVLNAPGGPRHPGSS